jgi:hypothetical protein
MRRSGLDKEPVPHVHEPNTQAMMDIGLRTLLSGALAQPEPGAVTASNGSPNRSGRSPFYFRQ